MTWQVTGASEPGTSHLEDGRQCDDAHASWFDERAGVLVLAVADGAGSAAHGAEAARIAVDTVIEACQHRLPQLKRGKVDTPERWEAFLHYLVHAVRYDLERRAARWPSKTVSDIRRRVSERSSPIGPPPGQFEPKPSQASSAPAAMPHLGDGRDVQRPGSSLGQALSHDGAPTGGTVELVEAEHAAAPATVAHALESLELAMSTPDAEGTSGGRRSSAGAPSDDAGRAPDLGWASIDPLAPPLGRAQRDDHPKPAAALRDFATPLLVTVVTESWLACVQIGDGVIVLRRDGVLEALTRPAKGEYANQTDFVTADLYAETAQSCVLRNHGADAIALMSDGLERLAIELATNTPHAAFFRNLFTFAGSPDLGHDQRQAALSQELRSDKVNRLTDDDKTLLVAVRAISPGHRSPEP